MPQQLNYWSAWMAGWVSATKTILEAQQRALENFLPLTQRTAGRSLQATAGDKPALAPRRRGRPAKAAGGARRRGRPPKSARG